MPALVHYLVPQVLVVVGALDLLGGMILLPRWFKKVGPGTFREVPESDVPQSYIDSEAKATALQVKRAREEGIIS